MNAKKMLTEEKIKDFVITRLILISFALLTGFFYGIIIFYTIAQGANITTFAFISIFLFIIYSFLSIINKKIINKIFNISSLIDLILITTTIYFSGLSASPFIIFYIPLLMKEVYLHSPKRGFLAGSCFLLTYIIIIFGIQSNLLPSLTDTLIMPAKETVLQITVLAIFFLIVIKLTNCLKIRITNNYINKQNDLLKITATQEILIEGIPESVIVLNNLGQTVKINSRAIELFNVEHKKAIGQKIEDLICTRFPTFPQPIIQKGRYELTISDLNKQEFQLCYTAQPIFNIKTSEQIGIVYIFQDITKIHSAEELLNLQTKIVELVSEQGKNQIQLAHPKLHSFIGESKIMQKVFSLIEKVSSSDANVLIYGESGTGKELTAKAIHYCGKRSKQPFIALNCGAVPESLIESELFGHKKGAFTGAETDHQGMFQQAHGGTLFLDEIGELPLPLQAKLLRAIQEKKIRMVGSEQEKDVDVRIISATNRNLEEEVKAGRFRQDLFYRLHVVSIEMPPLRERKEDLPLLINSFLHSIQKDKAIPNINPTTMQLLLQYNYPGNVRELENSLEHALVLAENEILPKHLPEYIRNFNPKNSSTVTTFNNETLQDEKNILKTKEKIDWPINLDEILNNLEYYYLVSALEKSSGSKTKAAELLGINLRSIRYRLKKYDSLNNPN